MNKKENSTKKNEYSIDEYSPGGNIRIYVPDKWWHTENSLNSLSKKNMIIVKLSHTQKHTPKTLLYPGWDIKEGDYKVTLRDEDHLHEFKKSKRDKIHTLGFVVMIIVVVLIVLYVSNILGNSIFSDVNIK